MILGLCTCVMLLATFNDQQKLAEFIDAHPWSVMSAEPNGTFKVYYMDTINCHGDNPQGERPK